jgi:hypothetical protein
MGEMSFLPSSFFLFVVKPSAEVFSSDHPSGFAEISFLSFFSFFMFPFH